MLPLHEGHSGTQRTPAGFAVCSIYPKYCVAFHSRAVCCVPALPCPELSASRSAVLSLCSLGVSQKALWTYVAQKPH